MKRNILSSNSFRLITAVLLTLLALTGLITEEGKAEKIIRSHS